MQIRKNLAAVEKVVVADLRGDPIEVRKPLYIEQNTFDVDPDTSIFRIIPVQHLLDDVRSERLTCTRIGPMIWGDPSENPLLEQEFIDEVQGESITLQGIVADMFGSCWSLTTAASPEIWGYFSRDSESVRIQSTPRKLLHAAMDIRDPFFMLHHFVGKVEYAPLAEVEAYFADADFAKHLDSLGQGLVLSAVRLPDEAAKEAEVRLVYSLSRNEAWVRQHVQMMDDFVKIPFNWVGVLDRVVIGPHVRAEGRERIESQLVSLGINGVVDSDSTN